MSQSPIITRIELDAFEIRIAGIVVRGRGGGRRHLDLDALPHPGSAGPGTVGDECGAGAFSRPQQQRFLGCRQFRVFPESTPVRRLSQQALEIELTPLKASRLLPAH